MAYSRTPFRAKAAGFHNKARKLTRTSRKRTSKSPLIACLAGLLLSAWAGDALAVTVENMAPDGAHTFDGSALGLIWTVPFVGILLSIAVFPLVLPHFWHRHFGKVSAFWGLTFLIPLVLTYGGEIAVHEVAHTFLLEYIPFIILLLALFTAAGGVRLRGSLEGSPAINTGLLAFGTVIASWMGTTGAAMLLIRPLLRANEWRKHQVHTVVFFIFLVANIGGSLTPLGDPPLFLGFLKGVDFFWPTQHLFFPMLLMASILLVVFYCLDSYFYKREPEARVVHEHEPLRIEGGVNILCILGVLGAVLLSGVWESGVTFDVLGTPLELENVVRDLLLLGITALSWALTSRESREANGFTWFPIVEVAKLFAGIFLTIIPAIAILKAGASGALGPLIELVNTDTGPNNPMYFWVTGILSSFLDNAPTYLVFFNTAGGDAETLMGPDVVTLLAISAGAVFMGANTYIGNAPNFMVRAIAEDRGVKMPSFFGYMGWSIIFLMPLFAIVTVVFLL
ncbi:MAG: sodium:proton antiporter [Alphaproteobacteria bacterium]|nr:sodium:proton antiporter [Alphaproteobacteria bacterium]